jgi:predicted O-linked N-acetylglucosamine transferase (SPINDLY family)
LTSETSRQAAAALRQAGGQHYQAGRLAEAEASTREALRLAPDDVSAMANLGAILRAQRRTIEALEVLEAALRLAPDNGPVLINRTNVLNELQRWDVALECADRAIAAAPTNPFGHTARGNALVGLGRPDEAVESFRESLRLRPDNATARFNLATALIEASRPEQALEVYDAAILATPQAGEAHAERGHLLARLRRWAEAAESFDRAFERDPTLPNLAGSRLHARMRICDWRDFDRTVADLGERIDAGQRAALPFSTVAIPLSARRQLRCATTYSQHALATLPPRTPPRPGPRLRIGYFSADFHDHATGYLIAEMLELHDRQAFEVTAFSFGPSTPSPMRLRLQGACEHFVDVAALNAAAITDLAVRREIDIAVDLKGFTTDSRPKIFAGRAAPIQVSFLGYPMTTGAPFMDYLIADRILIGEEDRENYSEKFAWLPGCYQPNDRQRATASEVSTRADHGLPQDAFVFASFNGAFKTTPETFELWMEILKAVSGSVLWLLQDNPVAPENLRAAAAASGVDPQRLVFAPSVQLARHLERIAHADLFLDSFPCTAHTTASDAVWAGLPLLTRKGETFASRVAASVLTAAGLPDLIVDDAASYRATALALAQDPDRLRALRSRVAAARTSSLFDTPAYVQGLEDLFRRMHARRLAGLAPDHLA